MPIIDSQQSSLLRRATPISPRDRSDVVMFALLCGICGGALVVALPILIEIAMH